MVGDRPGPLADLSSLACGRLTINLAALADNYRLLAAKAAPTACAAVVKADAYGLGIDRVVPVLAQAGARVFFAALPEEGRKVRGLLDGLGATADVYVLAGLLPGSETLYMNESVIPVLNDLGQAETWANLSAHRNEGPLPCALHIDSGMNRLGLDLEELERLLARPDLLAALDLRVVMSHLCSADEPENPLNQAQHAIFSKVIARLPNSAASLANSSGIFLGARYHFDLARPGVALYGCNPTPGRPNPMHQVVTLEGKILQVRGIDAPQSVGYGATYRVTGPGRIATVGVGYADGYLRSLSNKGRAFAQGVALPLVGRVSMDLTTFDISALADDSLKPGDWVELIGANVTLDEVGQAAGTIGYEILTDLGRRYHRVYKDA